MEKPDWEWKDTLYNIFIIIFFIIGVLFSTSWIFDKISEYYENKELLKPTVSFFFTPFEELCVQLDNPTSIDSNGTIEVNPDSDCINLESLKNRLQEIK